MSSIWTVISWVLFLGMIGLICLDPWEAPPSKKP
jgi:hypothetical protein